MRVVRIWTVGDEEKAAWAGDDRCEIEQAVMMLADRRGETMVLSPVSLDSGITRIIEFMGGGIVLLPLTFL